MTQWVLWGHIHPLLGIYHDKIIIQKDTWTPVFRAALSTIYSFLFMAE